MTNKAPLQEKTVAADPSRIGFWDTTVGKTTRAALYLAVSAAVAGILADIQNDPQMFGVYTPMINLLLVFVKNLASPNVKNI